MSKRSAQKHDDEPKLQKKILTEDEYTKYSQSQYLPRPHKGFATLAIHAGQEPDSVHGSVNFPIHLSTTYAQKKPAEPYGEFDYTRCGNPTRQAFERCLAAVEYGKHAIAFSSGCAAMTCVLHLFNPGDHLIICDDVYGGTQRYIRHFTEKKHNITVDFVDLTKIDEVERHFKDNTKLVWIETPTNPTLKVIDIQAIAELTRKKRGNECLVLCDNTFATMYLQSPLQLGCDIVLHSCTKYVGGHSDLVMGGLVFNDDQLNDKLFFAAKSIGGCPSIFDCYLAMRGLKTLEARMKVHCQNAFSIANYLEAHPLVEKLYYPGLLSHEHHEIAKKQMRGFGGMISFVIKGGQKKAADQFLSSLQVFTLAESLGGVESLAELPAVMTHGSVPKEHREKLGITDSFIRISVGIESLEDQIADLEKALQASQK